MIKKQELKDNSPAEITTKKPSTLSKNKDAGNFLNCSTISNILMSQKQKYSPESKHQLQSLPQRISSKGPTASQTFMDPFGF